MDATKSACFNSASTAPALTGVPSSQSALWRQWVLAD